jgi:hypothetical protein
MDKTFHHVLLEGVEELTRLQKCVPEYTQKRKAAGAVVCLLCLDCLVPDHPDLAAGRETKRHLRIYEHG